MRGTDHAGADQQTSTLATSSGHAWSAIPRDNGMNNPGTQAIRLLSACMMTAAMSFAATVVASPPTPLPPPDSPQIYAAGVACDFALRIDLSGSKYHLKPFFDKNGDLVRLIIAGKGSTIAFTNMESGATLSVNAFGFSVDETFGADGTITDTIRGHVNVINTPRDPTDGAWTRMYVGRLVLTTDPATGFGTVQSFSGKETDICAALS